MNAVKVFERLKESLEKKRTEYNAMAEDKIRLMNEKSKGYQEGINACLDCIKRLEFGMTNKTKDNNNGWIMCSDSLPTKRTYEDGEPVEYIILIGGAQRPTTAIIDNNGVWCWFDYQNFEALEIMTIVRAWREFPELPEQYKLKENEE